MSYWRPGSPDLRSRQQLSGWMFKGAREMFSAGTFDDGDRARPNPITIAEDIEYHGTAKPVEGVRAPHVPGSYRKYWLQFGRAYPRRHSAVA